MIWHNQHEKTWIIWDDDSISSRRIFSHHFSHVHTKMTKSGVEKMGMHASKGVRIVWYCDLILDLKNIIISQFGDSVASFGVSLKSLGQKLRHRQLLCEICHWAPAVVAKIQPRPSCNESCGSFVLSRQHGIHQRGGTIDMICHHCAGCSLAHAILKRLDVIVNAVKGPKRLSPLVVHVSSQLNEPVHKLSSPTAKNHGKVQSVWNLRFSQKQFLHSFHRSKGARNLKCTEGKDAVPWCGVTEIPCQFYMS